MPHVMLGIKQHLHGAKCGSCFPVGSYQGYYSPAFVFPVDLGNHYAKYVQAACVGHVVSVAAASY
jgi:hypothetical protein